MLNSEYPGLPCMVPIVAIGVAALLSLPGCDAASEPTIAVGPIEVPAAVMASLGEPERRILADLIGFGAAVARDETEALGLPMMERRAMEARAAALPYGLAAEARGWDENELRAAYTQQPEWELIVRHVVRLTEDAVSTEDRERARSIAEEVAERARAGEDFARLAAEFSQEPGAAARGGLLQPGRRGSWVDPFWEAAAALSPGAVTDVVTTTYGYHVIKLEERRPVPFEEASRTELLLRIVPGGAASLAAEEWSRGDGSIRVDTMAALAGRSAILEGASVLNPLLIASDRTGSEYRGSHLAAGWGLLDPGERAVLETEDATAYLAWVVEEARTVLRAAAADRAGLDTPDSAVRSAQLEWLRRVAVWAHGLGFRPGMSDDQVRAAAVEALLSGVPEARSARLELRSIRPRLREIYPVTGET